MNRAEAIGSAMAPAFEDDDDVPLIIVHRDIPGEHVESSRECWCSPHIVRADDLRPLEQITAEIEAAERKQ